MNGQSLVSTLIILRHDVKFTVLLIGWKTAGVPDAAEARRPASHDPRRPDIT